MRGRDRHLLVKLSFYQDKINVMKKARQALAGKNYYIVDDLTKADLMERGEGGRRFRTSSSRAQNYVSLGDAGVEEMEDLMTLGLQSECYQSYNKFQ